MHGSAAPALDLGLENPLSNLLPVRRRSVRSAIRSNSRVAP